MLVNHSQRCFEPLTGDKLFGVDLISLKPHCVLLNKCFPKRDNLSGPFARFIARKHRHIAGNAHFFAAYHQVWQQEEAARMRLALLALAIVALQLSVVLLGVEAGLFGNVFGKDNKDKDNSSSNNNNKNNNIKNKAPEVKNKSTGDDKPATSVKKKVDGGRQTTPAPSTNKEGGGNFFANLFNRNNKENEQEQNNNKSKGNGKGVFGGLFGKSPESLVSELEELDKKQQQHKARRRPILNSVPAPEEASNQPRSKAVNQREDLNGDEDDDEDDDEFEVENHQPLPSMPRYQKSSSSNTNNKNNGNRRRGFRRRLEEEEDEDEEIAMEAEEEAEEAIDHAGDEYEYPNRENEDDDEDDDDDEADEHDAQYMPRSYYEDSDDEQADEEPQPKGPAGRISNKKDRAEYQRVYLNTSPKGAKRPMADQMSVKPTLRPRRVKLNHLATTEAPKGKFWSRKNMLKNVKSAYKKTGEILETSAKKLGELPKLVEQATDSVNAMLQLDNKGKLLALIDKVDADIHFVRREFSFFSIIWAPIMEDALNYIGDTKLHQLRWNLKDELDFRRDALFSLAFAYEFMRLMIGWRENMLLAHEAYKSYLESIKQALVDGDTSHSHLMATNGLDLGDDPKHVTLDEDAIFRLSTIHSYLLLSSWMVFDEVAMEPRMKLDFLMKVLDDGAKNYESKYFRNSIILQEYYEPTIDEFKRENGQIEMAIARVGLVTGDFEDVDAFFDQFRDDLEERKLTGIDWEVPEELSDFIKKLSHQIQYNHKVYPIAFLEEIREAKRAQGDA